MIKKNTQWSHKRLNYTNKADMPSFTTMLLMSYLSKTKSRAFPFVSLHKRKSYILHKHGNNFMEIKQFQQAILGNHMREKNDTRFFWCYSLHHLVVNLVVKWWHILLNGYLPKYKHIQTGQGMRFSQDKLLNLTSSQWLFPFSISTSKNTYSLRITEWCEVNYGRNGCPVRMYFSGWEHLHWVETEVDWIRRQITKTRWYTGDWMQTMEENIKRLHLENKQ